MKKRFYQYLILGLVVIVFSNCKDKTDPIVFSYYDTGEKYEEYQYKTDSVKHGIYRKYSKKGFLVETAHYTDGKLDGERVVYNFDNGVKEISEIYKNDILDGRYILYHSNGEMNMLGVYKNNVLSGSVSFYDTTGELEKEAQFVNNFEVIPFKEFHENGNLKFEGSYRFSTFINGRAEFGLLKEYNKEGELIRKKMCNEKSICKTIWTSEESK